MERIVLVTGGAGFIGSHLCEALLNQGMQVVNLDNFCDNYEPAVKSRNIAGLINSPGFHLYKGDIRDSQLLERIKKNHALTDLIHLAALAGVRRSISDPLEYVDVDIKGTVNLLELAAKSRISRFIFASSSSVYGTSPPPFRETASADRPVSPYAAAKRAGELYCRTYHELYKIPVACLRFFTVYGPRQRPDMAIHLFTRLIDQGLEIPVFGTGSSKRDFTYISDIIDGIMRTLFIPLTFDLFNLGSSQVTTLTDLINIISCELGKKARIVHHPLQPGDVPETAADLAHSYQILGYQPQVSLPEGIKSFVDWYQKTKVQ
jgi:UDP-glucuronate 4-epimerase